MKNIATDLELNGKPSYGCHENNFFHGDVCVMGRVNIDKIPKIISKDDEYSVDPNVLPKVKLHPGKANTTIECQCGKNNIGESRISANNISTTSLPSYLCWEDAYRKVCEKGHEIRPAFWNSTIRSGGSTEKFSCSGARFEKLCMSNGNVGAETRRMVRSASLVFDLCPKSDHLDICSEDVTHIVGSKTSDVSLAEVIGKCNYNATGRIGISANSHSNAATIRRASVPGYCGAPAPKSTSLPLTLTAALERIPLAYNPQTKQLHIISVNPVSNQKYPAVEKNSASKTDRQSEHGLKCFDTSQTTEPTKEEAQNDSCKFLGRRSTHCQSSHANNDSHSGVGTHEEYSRTTLRRVSTSGSLPSRAECSSFSSISSLSTEFSVSATSAFEDVTSEGGGKSGSILDSDEANFIEINLDHPPVRPSVQDSTQNGPTIDEHCASTQGAKPKRRGISGFLSRNLLSWKSSKEASFHNDGAPGWNFFMRTQPVRDPNKVIQDYHERQGNTPANSNLSDDGCLSPRSRRSEDLVASSTTALILENRPSNLPAKAPEEELKHRLQYTQMVEAAKKKELKEAKLKKKLLQQQLRHEEQLSLASKIWNNEILPFWDTMKQSRKTKDLWWRGIPPSVRGKVWKLAIGNDLHITPELYEICVCRAKDRIRMAAECISVSEDDTEDSDKEASVELIKLDVSRTFPQLCIFQKGGPYYDMLHSLLGAYVCYRPDVGYVQGMSFLAAVLILNLEVADAFICFANLLNQPCQLAFFRLDEPMMKSYFLTYEEFFKENMPKLFNHFTRQHLSPDLYLIDWIYTLYSRSLPLDVASRVWDVFFRDGDEFLFRTALGILRLYEDILLNLDFIHLAQFLTKLPEDIAAGPLFKSIECIRMVSEKRSFSQVLLNHAELQQT